MGSIENVWNELTNVVQELRKVAGAGHVESEGFCVGVRLVLYGTEWVQVGGSPTRPQECKVLNVGVHILLISRE